MRVEDILLRKTDVDSKTVRDAELYNVYQKMSTIVRFLCRPVPPRAEKNTNMTERRRL